MLPHGPKSTGNSKKAKFRDSAEQFSRYRDPDFAIFVGAPRYTFPTPHGPHIFMVIDDRAKDDYHKF